MFGYHGPVKALNTKPSNKVLSTNVWLSRPS